MHARLDPFDCGGKERPMQVHVRKTPDEVDAAVVQQVTGDVTAALQAVATSGTQFIVNDT